MVSCLFTYAAAALAMRPLLSQATFPTKTSNKTNMMQQTNPHAHHCMRAPLDMRFGCIDMRIRCQREVCCAKRDKVSKIVRSSYPMHLLSNHLGTCCDCVRCPSLSGAGLSVRRTLVPSLVRKERRNWLGAGGWTY